MSNFRKAFYSFIILSFVLSLVSTSLVYAKGGDDSGSGGGSHDSGGSSGGGSSSGGSGSSGGGSAPQIFNTSSQNSGPGGGSNLPKPPAPLLNSAPVKPPKLEDRPKPLVKPTQLENEIENELGKEDIQAVTFQAKNGELELESENATGSSRPFNPKRGKNEAFVLRVREGSGSGKERAELKLKVAGDRIEFETKGSFASTNFPLSINDQGQLVVNTPNGPRVIRVLPDQASAIATQSGILHKIDEVKLEENPATSSAEPIFKASGITPSTLFGVLPVDVPAEVEVGAESGTVLSTNQPFWVRLFAPFLKPV